MDKNLLNLVAFAFLRFEDTDTVSHIKQPVKFTASLGHREIALLKLFYRWIKGGSALTSCLR